MTAPLAITGQGGDVTFDSVTYHVPEWKGTHEVETDVVTTTGSGGGRELIPTVEKMSADVKLFYDLTTLPLGTGAGIGGTSKIKPGRYGQGTLHVGTGTGANSYTATWLVVKIGAANIADKGITLDCTLESSGQVTVA
jgi:hypothetical protein